MANVVRNRTRHTLSPPALHDSNATIATRRASLLAQPAKPLTLAPAKAALPSRTLSRKRPAAFTPDADTRPPAKINRQLNGERAPPILQADDVPSTRSTPRPPSAGKLPGSSTAEKRSLRSHDGGSRLKSDLTTYFSNYDDIIEGLPKPAEFLDLDTPMYIIDEPVKPKTPAPTSPETFRKSLSPSRSRKSKLTTPPRRISVSAIPLAQSSTTFQVFDYTTAASDLHHHDGEDPLADAVYFTQHRRAERKEKQLRNIEKERAMHEKVQLERLLDGLQGPDWLKVMGITGVTDGERKDWEPKRGYFVKEVEALVDKFRIWKEAEKRLRAEKEAALAARDEESDDEGPDDDAPTPETEESDSIAVKTRPSNQHHHRPRSTPEPPKPRRPPRPHGFLLPFIPPVPTAPFHSFYAKPHLRAAALGKQRHGRNASAFGLPIPEWEEREFELPEEYIEPGFLRDNARQRRRRKRESGVGGD